MRRRCIDGDGGGKENLGRRFVELEKPVWARGVSCGEEGKGKDGGYEYRPLEVIAGTLIIINVNLLHMSGKNKSERDRMAWDLECPGDASIKPGACL